MVLMVALVGIQFYVINPALEHLPNGNYGEMYGPVSVLRWLFYPLILASGSFVVWRFFLSWAEPKQSELETEGNLRNAQSLPVRSSVTFLVPAFTLVTRLIRFRRDRFRNSLQ